MFAVHTPIKKPAAPKSPTTSLSPTAPPDTRQTTGSPGTQTRVRRSIGEWEASTAPTSPKHAPAAPSKPQQKSTTLHYYTESRPTALRTSTGTATSPSTTTTRTKRYLEARSWVSKAKIALKDSHNLRRDIKVDVTQAIDGLFTLVKEAEAERVGMGAGKEGQKKKEKDRNEGVEEPQNQEENIPKMGKEEVSHLLSSLADHGKLVREASEKMEELKAALQKQSEDLGATYATYASVAANRPPRQMPERTTLHSVIITSKEEDETGDEVLDRVRKAVKATEGGIEVERIRKAKDGKIVMSCRTREERTKVKERIEKAGDRLVVEDVKNKDPLLVLKGVLRVHSDEEIIGALRNQNKDVFHGLDEGEDRLTLKYRRLARNPRTCHVVVSVSPTIWRRAIDKGRMRIDLQPVTVEDQSPLVQCSRCLGYGHGRRHCKESQDTCSHCAGPHLRLECPQWQAGGTPECCNCLKAKLDRTSHSAFSQECPVRRRWEELARASVAYC